MRGLLMALCALIGAGRFFVPRHDPSLPLAYEATAHMLVGALIALACVGSIKVQARVLLAVLCAIELVNFFLLSGPP